MTDLLKIINDKEKRFTEKIKELQEYLNDNSEIVINKELFSAAIVDVISKKGEFINKQAVQIYLILHHCIAHDSAISEKKEKLSFQDVMKILDETVNRFITPQYFYKLINFQDQDRETLLHQAVISNNTDAIKVLFQKNANPLLKNKGNKIPLDLAQENTRKVLIKCMQDQAQSKKESARCIALLIIIRIR